MIQNRTSPPVASVIFLFKSNNLASVLEFTFQMNCFSCQKNKLSLIFSDPNRFGATYHFHWPSDSDQVFHLIVISETCQLLLIMLTCFTLTQWSQLVWENEINGWTRHAEGSAYHLKKKKNILFHCAWGNNLSDKGNTTQFNTGLVLQFLEFNKEWTVNQVNQEKTRRSPVAACSIWRLAYFSVLSL